MSVVIGARVAGGYHVTDAIWDHPGRGRYRGIAAVEPLGQVLIAVTAAQQAPLADVRARLALELDGVTPLRAVGELDVPLGPLHGLVEDEPAGQPMSDLRTAGLSRAGVVGVGAQVADVAARAHDRGLALGGLHPELIYAEARAGMLVLTAIAPRAIEFFRTGGRVDAANIPAFDLVFEPVTVAVAGHPPSAASDVFALAGSLGYLATGRHPFADGSWAQQVDAMTRRDGGWRDVDDPLLRLLETCLRRDPSSRPTAAQLRDRIAALA